MEVSSIIGYTISGRHIDLEDSGDGEPLYVDDIQSFVGAGVAVTSRCS